jgi:hypothetical protein
MKRLIWPVLLLMTACGTPQERCIGAGTRDLRVVERLIIQTQGNIERGYAWQQEVKIVPTWVNCTDQPTPENPNPARKRCLVDETETSTVPLAIDLNAEAALLESLREKRTAQIGQAQGLIAACQAKHPE